MTTHEFEIKEGDTGPDLATVLLGSDRRPVDLTNALSVTLTMALAGHPRTKVIDAATAIFAADATGAVRYVWQPGDTDTVGTYNIEWHVVWGDDFEMTFPSVGYDKVVICASL